MSIERGEEPAPCTSRESFLSSPLSLLRATGIAQANMPSLEPQGFHSMIEFHLRPTNPLAGQPSVEIVYVVIRVNNCELPVECEFYFSALAEHLTKLQRLQHVVLEAKSLDSEDVVEWIGKPTEIEGLVHRRTCREGNKLAQQAQSATGIPPIISPLWRNARTELKEMW